MAEKAGVSEATVRRIWHAHGLKPHLSRSFKVSNDPEFAEKLADVVAVNDAEAYVATGLKGVGLIQAARFMALPHLQSGALVEVLSQWKPLPLPISAVYPHNRHLSPTVRAFVDWVAELFERCPLLSGQKDVEDKCPPASAPVPKPRVIAVDAGLAELMS